MWGCGRGRRTGERYLGFLNVRRGAWRGDHVDVDKQSLDAGGGREGVPVVHVG